MKAMPKAIRYIFTSLFLTAFLSATPPTPAQESAPDSPSGSAADLRITPRLGVGYSTSGAGYDGFGRFEGFVPLLQTPGSTLTFLEGRLLLDNGAHLGGNLLLGHRFYSQETNRIFGGYFAYDSRETGESTFHQLGLGLESLGEVWDVRLNGYLPIGDTRQTVEERVFDTGLQLSNLSFQDNFLVVEGRRERREVRRLEAAMGGFDLEAGARIARLGSTGDLRGYGGLYYYDGAGTDGSLGWRLRLEARPTDALSLGLAVQEDEIFGTNVVFNLGATFPGTRPSEASDRNSVIARMGESVGRTASIAVDVQEEVGDSFVEQIIERATNLDTGEPYFFQQVDLQAVGGDGTAETPFGTVEAALAASGANQIVYVQGTSPPEIPGFTIPDGVSVLSAAPVQQIETVEFGLVQLPQSGSGNFPRVRGTVTMGNDTVLSGFAIASETGAAIVASNINNTEIRDNTITSSAQAGILIQNTAGTVTLTDNVVTGNGVSALTAIGANNITLTGGSLTSTNSESNGIFLSDVNGTVAINNSPIAISEAGEDGIFLQNINGTVEVSNSAIAIANSTESGIEATNVTGTVNLTAISGSQITTNGTEAGINLNESTGSVNLSGFEVSSTGGAVIEGTNVNNVAIANSTLTSSNSATNGISLDGVTGQFDVSNSTITIDNPTNNGIAATGVSGTVNLEANAGSQITTNTTEAGINLSESEGSVNLSGFEVSSTGGAVIEGTNVNNVAIANSTLTSSNSATNGISLDGVTGEFDVSNSTITIDNPTNNGIAATGVSGTVNLEANAGSQIITTNADTAGISVAESTGSVNLSGFAVSSTGGAALEAITVNNLGINNSTLTSINATTPGILLDTVSGDVEISNSTIAITNPLDNVNGISVANVTGDVNIAANQGSEITEANIGVALENSPGAIAISGLRISDTQASGIFGTNLANVTLQNNEIDRANGQGIALENITDGTVAIADNTITDTVAIDELSGQGIRLVEVTGTVEITGNTITGTEGIVVNFPMAGVIGSGQGIAIANTTGNIDLTISGNNQISENFNDGILIGLIEDATANLTILGNTFASNGGNAPVRGDGIGIGLEQSATATLTIAENIFSNNFDEGIDIRLGLLDALLPDPTEPQLDGAIENNTITGNGGNGVQATVANGNDSNLCLRLLNNTASGNGGTDFPLSAVVGTFRLEPLAGNVGTVMTTGVTPVAAGTCAVP
jgi:hypothetical protein